MITIKITTKSALLLLVAVLFLASTVVFAADRQDQSGVKAGPSPANPASLSPALSYYFISGNTFTAPGGSIPYSRQVTGCVNQMPRNLNFSAPVHLPQGSQVVSMTLYTYNNVVTSTISTASFIEGDGLGNAYNMLSVDSQPNPATYQQHVNTVSSPTTIDNQNYNYSVEWYTHGTFDSPILSLCGVRLIYHAPLGVVAYLPAVTKQ